MKCVLCERRPAKTDDGYCTNCDQGLDAETRRRENNNPVKFLTYRGHVVGLYHNGGGSLIPRLLKRSPDNLPKKKTLNLNRYIEGFARAEIKRFKACVLQLAHA